MDLVCPAEYRDRHGAISTELRNDGRVLSLSLRGVRFRGCDFDSLEPAEDTDPATLESFTLQHGLCACTIVTALPLPAVVGGDVVVGTLGIHLEVGEPRPNGSIDREVLSLTLTLDGQVYRSAGTSGWFEDKLLDLQRRLPEETYLKACITCAFSDYHPVGHGLFGGLACFRANKDGYAAVRSKDDLFRVWGTMTEFVQETYLCTEFQRRLPGTGYRG